VLEGALEGERARVREGRRDEFLKSQLRGGDPAPSCGCFDVPIFLDVVVDVCFSFLVSVKSTMKMAILNVSCYSLSPPFLWWQFCLVYIYDCLRLLVCCNCKTF
jgi:hypothetical protein